MSTIFLIGMPGSGKSHWAHVLSSTYALPCIDLDQVIEAQVQMSISSFFEQYGEPAFRQKESSVLKEVIATQQAGNTIIACGGGTPCFYNNMALMKQAGCVVYIKTAIDTLTARLETTYTQRPLLTGNNINEVLAQLLAARKDKYETADYILQEETLTLSTFEKIISSCTNRP